MEFLLYFYEDFWRLQESFCYSKIFIFRKCIIYDILKNICCLCCYGKISGKTSENWFLTIYYRTVQKDSESTLDVQWRLDTLNTNKIFAGFFNFFRKWKVKKNQITLVEKLNTGGTGSLFEIKNECEKRGLPFHFNII